NDTRPNVLEQPISVQPVGVYNATKLGDSWYATGAYPTFYFSLPGPQYVTGIRLDYTDADVPHANSTLLLTWTSSSTPVPCREATGRTAQLIGWRQNCLFSFYVTSPDLQEDRTLWVSTVLRDFGIRLSAGPNPLTFKDIVLLEDTQP